MKTVVLLTVPRSGSSLLSGVLHRLGVHMGDKHDLVQSRHKNRFGSYENQSILKINHIILYKAKRLMLYWKRLSDEDGLVEKAVKKYEDKLIKVIRENEKELWGFKEAVIIYTLPYFHHHLTNPYYITLYRDPDSVANSQINASKLSNWFPEIRMEFSYFKPHQWFVLTFRTLRTTFTKGFIYKNHDFLKEVIIDEQERIQRFVTDKKNITINLEDITDQPLETINKICSFLDIKPTKKQIQEAIDFIHPELLISEVPKKKSKRKSRKKN